MKTIFKTKGQIKRHQQIGDFITSACAVESNRVFVEVGTWKGLGSTLIFLQSLQKRSNDFYFYSVESNYNFYSEAKRNLRKKFKYFNNFFLIYGYISDPANLNIENLNSEEQIWLDEDIKNYTIAPSVRHLMPKNIDVLLLDGGEFSSLSEFQYLKTRLSNKATVILDGINVRKNKMVLDLIKNDPDYTIEKSSNERNGTALVTYLRKK